MCPVVDPKQLITSDLRSTEIVTHTLTPTRVDAGSLKPGGIIWRGDDSLEEERNHASPASDGQKVVVDNLPTVI